MQEFLADQELESEEITNATKNRYEEEQALVLANEADVIVAVRGKQVTIFDMKNDPPDEETLKKKILGPTGNLRAPTLKIGNRLFVGFNEDALKEFLEE